MKRVLVRSSWSCRSYDVFLMEYTGDARTRIVTPIKVETREIADHEFLGPPSFQVRETEMLPWVKALLEGLEEAGLVDKVREDQGVLKATRAHLEDMRTMADRMLGKLVQP